MTAPALADGPAETITLNLTRPQALAVAAALGRVTGSSMSPERHTSAVFVALVDRLGDPALLDAPEASLMSGEITCRDYA